MAPKSLSFVGLRIVQKPKSLTNPTKSMHWIDELLYETELGVVTIMYPPTEYLIGRLSLKVADVVVPTVLDEIVSWVMLSCAGIVH